MMTLPTGKRTTIKRLRQDGFTLIELVLVMAILIVVLATSGASLVGFFKGRALDAEARRFVTLARHAQNRAIAEGLPMTLWIDPEERKYGLEIAAGFVERDPKGVEYQLARDVQVEVSEPLEGALVRLGKKVHLRFSPDGFLNENNPEVIEFKSGEGESLFIAPTRNRTIYEISTNQAYIARR